LLLKNI